MYLVLLRRNRCVSFGIYDDVRFSTFIVYHPLACTYIVLAILGMYVYEYTYKVITNKIYR